MAAFGLWGDNPYDASAEYMDQIPGVQQQYLGMYNRGGHILYPALGAGYGEMALHPGQVQTHMGNSFEADPSYQWQLDQELQANDQAMAAGGMSGSPQSQQFAMDTSQQMANRSYNDYMRRQMGIANSGMQGLQGLENQGWMTSNNMANSMTDYLYNRSNLAGAQAQNRNNMFWGGMGAGLSYL
jgi:hypothetical protein